MYRFSKYKEQYRANLQLAIPVVLSQLGQVVVQIADTTMVGLYGGDDPTPLAAVAFANALFFISFVTVMGMTFGITPLVGELYAQGKSSIPTKYFQNSIVLYSLLAIFAVALQYLLIPIMGYMGQPAEVVEMAVPYYKSLVWSMVPVIMFFTVKQFLEGIGNTKVAMYTVIISNSINIALNYILINGKWGAPEMGALGAGIATYIARVLQAAIIIYYFWRATQFKIYRDLFSRYNFSIHTIKRLFALGFPISMQIFMEASTFSIVSFMFGAFGATAISANQIGLTLGNASFMIVVAIGIATTIRISHCYGLRDVAQMRLASKAAWHLAGVWNLVVAILFFAMRHTIPLLFTTNREVIELTSILIVSIAAYQIVDGIQCIAVGILRGMQDVKIIPLYGFFAYWVCNLPIAYLCAFTLDMGAKGLYMGFVSGFTVASVLMCVRIKKGQKRLLLS